MLIFEVIALKPQIQNPTIFLLIEDCPRWLALFDKGLLIGNIANIMCC